MKNVWIARQFWLGGAPLRVAWPSAVTENTNSMSALMSHFAGPNYKHAGAWTRGTKMGANERLLCSKSTLVANFQALSERSQCELASIPNNPSDLPRALAHAWTKGRKWLLSEERFAKMWVEMTEQVSV